MATTEELLTEVRDVLKQHTPLLQNILQQGKETNGRVLKLENAEDKRTALAQSEADFRAKGWRPPDGEPGAARVSKTDATAAGIIGSVVAGIALGAAKVLGL